MMEEPLLYYEVHGKQGPYLLLVHGILSSRVQWMPNLEAVAKRLEEEGRKVLDEFPLHPSQNRHLKPEIREALLDDMNLINLRGLSYNLQYMVPRCSVYKMLHENQIPTLLIVGRFDKQFTPLLAFAEKTIPNLQVLVYDGGHAVNIDAAEHFNQAVQNFICRF